MLDNPGDWAALIALVIYLALFGIYLLREYINRDYD